MVYYFVANKCFLLRDIKPNNNKIHFKKRHKWRIAEPCRESALIQIAFKNSQSCLSDSFLYILFAVHGSAHRRLGIRWCTNLGVVLPFSSGSTSLILRVLCATSVRSAGFLRPLASLHYERGFCSTVAGRVYRGNGLISRARYTRLYACVYRFKPLNKRRSSFTRVFFKNGSI